MAEFQYLKRPMEYFNDNRTRRVCYGVDDGEAVVDKRIRGRGCNILSTCYDFLHFMRYVYQLDKLVKRETANEYNGVFVNVYYSTCMVTVESDF